MDVKPSATKTTQRGDALKANASPAAPPASPSSSSSSLPPPTASTVRSPICGAAQLGSALLYAVASILIMSVNKIVLTSWGFPSAKFLGLAQFLFTSGLLFLLSSKPLGLVAIRPLSRPIVSRLAPITLLFVVNVVTGLMGTGAINLAMFGALRRFSILMTMIAEFFVLGTRPSNMAALSVGIMLLGAIVAASDDLTFDAAGYAMVFINNLCTAGSGVCVKRGLSGPYRLTKFELLYYQSLGAAPLLGLLLYANDEFSRVAAFDGWLRPGFVACFLMSCVMGLCLNYATALCTQMNSATTTTIVGCCKNVLIAYLAMAGLLGGDYVFSLANCLGLNLSVFGSIIFSTSKIRGKGKKPQPQPQQRETAEDEITKQGQNQWQHIPSSSPSSAIARVV